MGHPADKFLLKIADLTIEAELFQYYISNKLVWRGKVTDTFSKTTHLFELSADDMGIVIGAFVAGADSGTLYQAAAQIVKDWPRECRPVP